MRRFLRDNGLTIALALLFLGSLAGLVVAGWAEAREQAQEHHAAAPGLLAYLVSGEFISAVFENWESEFLQMGAYVVLTARLFQRGSAESRDPDDPGREHDEATPGLRGWLYAHSLGLALGALFLLSFALHLLGSWRVAVQDGARHGAGQPSLWEHMLSAPFWFESMQNWQSEFLSTGVLVVLSIVLRHRGSPESKPVQAGDGETGAG